MKASTIVSALALYTLASASPLEVRDGKTKTVTATSTKYKTRVETETDILTRYKTRTITETATEVQYKTKTRTVQQIVTQTTTRTKSVPTTKVVTSVSTAPVKTSKIIKSITVTVPTTKLSTIISNVPTSTITRTLTVPTTQLITITSSKTATITQSIQGPTITAIQTVCPGRSDSASNMTVVTLSKTVTEYASSCTLPSVSPTSTSGSSSGSISTAVSLATGYIQIVNTGKSAVEGQCGFVDTNYNNALSFTGSANDTTAPQTFSLTSDGHLTTGNYTVGGTVYAPSNDLDMDEPITFMDGLTSDQLSGPSYSYRNYKPLNCSVSNAALSCTIGQYLYSGLQKQEWDSSSKYAQQNGLYILLYSTSTHTGGGSIQFVEDIGDCANASQ